MVFACSVGSPPDRLKKYFFSNVTHALKSPLTAVTHDPVMGADPSAQALSDNRFNPLLSTAIQNKKPQFPPPAKPYPYKFNIYGGSVWLLQKHLSKCLWNWDLP